MLCSNPNMERAIISHFQEKTITHIMVFRSNIDFDFSTSSEKQKSVVVFYLQENYQLKWTIFTVQMNPFNR